jgi:hypothetical protein
MPGMNQRLMLIENASRKNGERITNGLTKVDATISALSESMVARDVASDKRQAEFHLAMAARLGFASTGTINGTIQGVVPASSSPAQQRRLVVNNGASLPASKHRLAMQHQSLQTLYDEWYGIGECLDLPVPGGIAALEANHKAKWRNHFSGHEIKNFSRVKMVVTGIDEMQRRTQRPIDSVIDELDLVFKEEAKKSVAKMVIIVQKRGLVDKKKSRGKTKLINQ